MLPVSAVVPTRHRHEPFRRTLESLAKQSAQPAEIVVVDGSTDSQTRSVCDQPPAGLESKIVYRRAEKLGAAIQRNQGVSRATYEVIWFLDDDILFEPDCVARQWSALQSDPNLGGVNATITNQRYSPPGRFSSLLFRILNGKRELTYAGRVLGPGVNLLPDDRDDLPEIVPTEWLNTTCTMYRRAALPDPPFPDHFTGYSLCEDLTLSLSVGRKWKLANAHTARIFHDSQPGDHKRSHADLAKMELVNRHYVMTEVLNRRGIADYIRFGVWEAFQIVATSRSRPRHFVSEVYGKTLGIMDIIRGMV